VKAHHHRVLDWYEPPVSGSGVQFSRFWNSYKLFGEVRFLLDLQSSGFLEQFGILYSFLGYFGTARATITPQLLILGYMPSKLCYKKHQTTLYPKEAKWKSNIL